jgi:hypothetical protein
MLPRAKTYCEILFGVGKKFAKLGRLFNYFHPSASGTFCCEFEFATSQLPSKQQQLQGHLKNLLCNPTLPRAQSYCKIQDGPKSMSSECQLLLTHFSILHRIWQKACQMGSFVLVLLSKYIRYNLL